MLFASIRELPAAPVQAVIINVGTKWVSTLALLSALRYVDAPVLLVDCEYGDGSLAHFTKLMETHRFDILPMPLKKHGETLDAIFRDIPADKVLLIDSDVEILDGDIVRLAKNWIEAGEEVETVFGSGFTHGPSWLHDRPDIGFYQERMWIPFTLLRASCVREALASGLSFCERTILNDFAPWPFLSRMLALRFRSARFRNSKLSWLNFFKRTYYGHRPPYVFCDTGADIFQHLKYGRGMRFAGIPAELHRRYVSHFHGATRRLLDPGDLNSLQNRTLAQVRDRLEKEYGIAVS